ncbi:MAG: helix-turn-helix domain-containing protein, partial [Melioribacteraceae bacterium]|nr:helix-turn-helix domain-containing protein [Melioribacteraceae bacterium]
MSKRNYIKLIFGLKLKQLRQNKKLSLSDLASKSNLSVSYINEIESGKKYPKIDKIDLLAKSLDVTYDELVSLKLMRNLAPIEELLDSNLLEQLPLDHYGLDMNKMISAISSSSLQLSVLISTFIETAKSSEISQNNFSKTALRTFKEFNENYFEDLEDAVNDFKDENDLLNKPTLNYNQLKPILEKNYNYKVDASSLNKYPEFNDIRALVINKTQNKLMLNSNLETHRKAFVLAKELAYNFLNIEERSYLYSSVRLKTYDHLVNYFYTSYFATALIINKSFLIPDLKKIFGSRKWSKDKFLPVLDKYNATPEMFFQRIANLLAKEFGLNKLFFLRFN